jgi:site-specific DNA-cytosine methylase
MLQPGGGLTMTAVIEEVAACKCGFKDFWAVLLQAQCLGVPTRRKRYVMVASVDGRVQNWFLKQVRSLHCLHAMSDNVADTDGHTTFTKPNMKLAGNAGGMRKPLCGALPQMLETLRRASWARLRQPWQFFSEPANAAAGSELHNHHQHRQADAVACKRGGS